MEITSLFIIAILVEAIWENIKTIWEDGVNINRVGPLILAVIICALANINIFNFLGIDLAFNIVGCIFTGILVSRGANAVSDIFSKINNYRKVKGGENEPN